MRAARQALEAAAAANDACVHENAHLREQLQARPSRPQTPRDQAVLHLRKGRLARMRACSMRATGAACSEGVIIRAMGQQRPLVSTWEHEAVHAAWQGDRAHAAW
jgi:hypothetical protein